MDDFVKATGSEPAEAADANIKRRRGGAEGGQTLSVRPSTLVRRPVRVSSISPGATACIRSS